MKLLTDGRERDPILCFCLDLISHHSQAWPPSEDVLAQEFVTWFGVHSFVTNDGLIKLCSTKRVNLSFTSLPREIRGFNCSFAGKREIVITDPEIAPFVTLHTLLHEFREMLEHVLTELGHPTIGPEDFLEIQAEQFASMCRIEAAYKELPGIFEMAQNVENKWARYLFYLFVLVFGVAHIFSCIYMPQIEEIGAEARRQRYVRM